MSEPKAQVQACRSTPAGAELAAQAAAEMATERQEMAAFVAWAVQKYRQHAYRHTSATSGEWAAWRAARAHSEGRIYTQGDLLKAVETERHACSIAVWMTLQDALAPDADDKGLDGWMREAEARVKGRP